MVSADSQDISSLNHCNSSFTMTTLSSNGSTTSTASTDRISPAPPDPRSNNYLHFVPNGSRPDSLPVYSRPAPKTNPGANLIVSSCKDSAPRPSQMTHRKLEGYPQKAKQSRGVEDEGNGHMSKDFRKGKPRFDDSLSYPVPFDGMNNRTFAPAHFVTIILTYFQA